MEAGGKKNKLELVKSFKHCPACERGGPASGTEGRWGGRGCGSMDEGRLNEAGNSESASWSGGF